LKETADKQPEKLRENIDVIADQLFQLTLQPLDVVYNRFHQIIKDVAQSLEKKAELVIDGSPAFLGPEAHYLVINAMIHLLRNSMDHGIEPPELRSELGKDPMGTIRIRTAMNHERVYIIISDDGAGIDPQAIAEIAVGKGFVTEEDVAAMTDQQKTELILVPGFSSRESVSDLSGRGVGMDVVAEAMKGLGGTLSIFSELDVGTTLTLEFPVSKREGRPV
jgi:two-component system chemotaxis sensor kinase CheA